MKTIAFSILFVVTHGLTAQAADDVVQLELSAGKHARERCVVSCTLPEKFSDSKHLSLMRTADGKSIPVQIDSTAEGKRIYWILNKKLPAKQTRRYNLQSSQQPFKQDAPVTNTVTLKIDGKQIRIAVSEKPVLVYHQAIVKSPLKDAPYYARSGYIHPLYTPSGKEITDDFNPDHAHQHGVMFAWRKILFDGRHNNAWDQKQNTGRIEHGEVKAVAVGPVFATFTALLKHVDLTAKQAPVTMLNETWRVRVYAFADDFLFDIISTQTCATDKPVVIEKYHYGGMTIRGHADWMDTKTFDFLTNENKTRADGNHSRPNWVAMHGLLQGEPVGITIFDHPHNFRFPQPVRLHPKMPYFCFVPAQLGEFRIEPGKPFVSQYRYHIHHGKTNSVVANQIWDNYTQAAHVTVVK